MLRRLTYFAYGAVCYLVFFGTFLYLMGFVTDLIPSKTVSAGTPGDVASAIAIDVGLVLLFGMQHSIMARQWFKRAWTRIVPKPVERSTFVLFTSAILMFLFWQWRPVGGAIWEVTNPELRLIVQGIGGIGWCLVLLSTFLIDHFDLFGLRQVYLYLVNRPYTNHRFRQPLLYRFVRHPLYLGFLIAFWSAPTMTVSRLVLATLFTSYILIAIRFEEKDLIMAHGMSYERYRQNVPMLIPGTKAAAEPRVAAQGAR